MRALWAAKCRHKHESERRSTQGQGGTSLAHGAVGVEGLRHLHSPRRRNTKTTTKKTKHEAEEGQGQATNCRQEQPNTSTSKPSHHVLLKLRPMHRPSTLLARSSLLSPSLPFLFFLCPSTLAILGQRPRSV
eukprot:3910282-Rhodomonas_salina.1